MTLHSSQSIGFVGLGAMGEPMALNLVRSRGQLTVWNRTSARCATLAEGGARVADSPSALFSASEVVFLMLSDGPVMDAVLARGTEEFRRNVSGRTIVNTATVSPRYSQALDADIRAAGGVYVEAPVSGSRKPAEQGQLVAMLAGDESAIARVEPLLASMCRATVRCGGVPGALRMKFAVNIFLIASMTGLAEAAHYVRSEGLDLQAWAEVVNASQMASDISRLKVDKLLSGDLRSQANIVNVLETTRLIVESAHEEGISTPLMDASLGLYKRADAMGLGRLDMIAVARAFSADGPSPEGPTLPKDESQTSR